VDRFYSDVLSGGSAAFMRTMHYTAEGDSIIIDYQFDGEMFTVTRDNSRDRFAAPKDRAISTETYKYLVPLDRSRPYGVLLPYFLSNTENIYTATSDGGTTLIDGLCSIPSPSEDRTSRQLPEPQETVSPSDVANIVERNLDVITEPSPVSNPYYYIGAHKAEYDEIVALGDAALQYMFSIFDKGNQHGLRGHVMASACRDILGVDFEFNASIDTGQKWYDAYKLIIIEKQPQNFHDLTNSGKLTVNSNDVSNYQLYTNSTSISVSVSGVILGERPYITLYDTDGMNDIMVIQIRPGETTGVFTNLTSAKYYCLVATGLDGNEITLSD